MVFEFGNYKSQNDGLAQGFARALDAGSDPQALAIALRREFAQHPSAAMDLALNIESKENGTGYNLQILPITREVQTTDGPQLQQTEKVRVNLVRGDEVTPVAVIDERIQDQAGPYGPDSWSRPTFGDPDQSPFRSPGYAYRDTGYRGYPNVDPRYLDPRYSDSRYLDPPYQNSFDDGYGYGDQFRYDPYSRYRRYPYYYGYRQNPLQQILQAFGGLFGGGGFGGGGFGGGGFGGGGFGGSDFGGLLSGIGGIASLFSRGNNGFYGGNPFSYTSMFGRPSPQDYFNSDDDFDQWGGRNYAGNNWGPNYADYYRYRTTNNFWVDPPGQSPQSQWGRYRHHHRHNGSMWPWVLQGGNPNQPWWASRNQHRWSPSQQNWAATHNQQQARAMEQQRYLQAMQQRQQRESQQRQWSNPQRIWRNPATSQQYQQYVVAQQRAAAARRHHV